MKTIILFILIISSTKVFSNWEKLPISTNYTYSLNNDTIMLFVHQKGWFYSIDNGDTWIRNHHLDSLKIIPHSQILFKDNLQIIDNLSGSNLNGVYVSTNYGKTFEMSYFNFVRYSERRKYFNNEINKIAQFDNVIFLATEVGVFFSLDNGKNFYIKDFPGVLSVYHSGILTEEEVLQIGTTFERSTNDVLVFDNQLFLSTNARSGILKTTKYDYKDTNNTLFYPSTDYYFFKKYNEFIHPYFNKSSSNILELNRTIFCTLTHSKSSELLKSNNHGDTWEFVDTESFGINNVSYLYKCGDVLYICSSEQGIFMSIDNSKTWINVSNGINNDINVELSNTIFAYIQFNDKFAFVRVNNDIYRAPLKDCKIVADVSSVDNNEKQEIKIYPNPANETVTISGIDFGKVEVYNSLGQLLINSEIQGTSNINTSTLPPGIYLLKIEHENEVTFEKLIINK